MRRWNVRNICAHYNRLYNQPLEEQPILPNRLRLYESNRLFPLLLTFAYTLGRERVFTRLVTGIALLEEDYPEADLACCGFPENWREILENEISSKNTPARPRLCRVFRRFQLTVSPS